MWKRRLIVISDDEKPRRLHESPVKGEGELRKKTLLFDDDEEEEEEEEEEETASVAANTDEEEKNESDKLSRRTRRGRWRGAKQEGEEGEDGEEEEEDPVEDARPVGVVIRVSGKGKERKYHFRSFEYDGSVYELEDNVLLNPEDVVTKPYVAIIKDITQNVEGIMYIIGQSFVRPEEAEKIGGRHREPCDNREIFYSFHLHPAPAESVMHKCIVHFIPLHKKLPLPSQHPGFIVQWVYDTVGKRLWKLTDKEFEDSKQHEIDVLIQKTQDRIGELPDVELEESTSDQADESLNKQNPKKKPVQPIDVLRTDEALMKYDHSKAETPGNWRCDVSVCKSILSKYKALTADPHRDRWLVKLLQGVKVAYEKRKDTKLEEKKLEDAGTLKKMHGNKESETSAATEASDSHDGVNNYWLDTAVQAITGLEKAAHEVLGSEFQKYNKKMRQLEFNLRSNDILARRLLNKELNPIVILNMSPNELKDGLTADERVDEEPEETNKLHFNLFCFYMTDTRCSICNEKRVGVAEIIRTGGGDDRYQLECISCGYHWYASQDDILSMTIESPSC